MWGIAISDLLFFQLYAPYFHTGMNMLVLAGESDMKTFKRGAS